MTPAFRHRLRRRVSPACIAVAVVSLSACGRKGPVRAPELVVPAPITDLSATNEAEAIVLAWSRPTKYVDGARMGDLGGFRIERAAGEEPFTLLATLGVPDRDRFRQAHRFRYADGAVSEGASLRYRVVSFTVDHYRSAPSNSVAIIREAPQVAPTPMQKDTP